MRLSPEKTISITYEGYEYTFVINLTKQTVDLILQRALGSGQDSIVSMHSIPDVVQIKFYKAIKSLQNAN